MNLFKLCLNYRRRYRLKKRFPCSFIHPYSVLNIADTDCFSLGKGCYVGAFSVLLVMEDVNSENCSQISRLKIGDGTYIGELNNIRAAGGIIEIGESVLISQNVSIIASGALL